MTPAAVSQQIRQLEADLGVSLFRRLPRGLVLTEAASSALPELGKAFAHLARAVEGVRGGSLVGPLVVSVDPLLRRALAGAAAGRVPRRLSRDRDHGPRGAAQRRLRARGRRCRHPLRQGDLSRAGDAAAADRGRVPGLRADAAGRRAAAEEAGRSAPPHAAARPPALQRGAVALLAQLAARFRRRAAGTSIAAPASPIR